MPVFIKEKRYFRETNDSLDKLAAQIIYKLFVADVADIMNMEFLSEH